MTRRRRLQLGIAVGRGRANETKNDLPGPGRPARRSRVARCGPACAGTARARRTCPRARLIALIANVRHPGETKERDTAQSAATALDLGVRCFPVKSEADLEAALADIARQGNLLTYGPLIEDVYRRLAEYVD